MIPFEKAKGIVDTILETSIISYERMEQSRQKFRERAISMFTLLFGILGIIIALQFSEEKTFFDLYLSSASVVKVLFIIFLFSSFVLFFIVFLSTKSKTLENSYSDMIIKVKTLNDSGDSHCLIDLNVEGLEVDEEYYVKIELIKSYSDATDFIIKNLRKLTCLFGFTMLTIIVTIISAFSIILQIF